MVTVANQPHKTENVSTGYSCWKRQTKQRFYTGSYDVMEEYQTSINFERNIGTWRMQMVYVEKYQKQCWAHRSKSLKYIFVKAKFTEGTLKNDSVYFIAENCKTKTCSWCKNVVKTATFKSNTSRKVLKIEHKMDCNFDWVIYLCECKLRQKQYVGKNETKLNIRWITTEINLTLEIKHSA